MNKSKILSSWFGVAILCILMCFSSCKSKNTPIDNLAELAEQIKINNEEYSDEDWQNVATELESIEEELAQYQEQYTDEEKKEIGRLKGICLGYMTKYSIKNWGHEMEDALKEAEGLIEGFSDAIGDGMEE